jgi:hypothetical protein
MLRKQILITEAQNDYLRALADATGESEGHIVRQAIELHASQLHPSSIPGLIYEEQPTENKTDELKS